MSIFPATDIISDVARAADPGRVSLAMKRLESMGGEKARAGDTTFALLKPAPTPARPTATVVRDDASAPRGVRHDFMGPAQKFEAFLLQGWLEVILPKQESGAYGLEAGGEIWRSMMAEQLSNQLVRAGGVGIQKLLDHKNSSIATARG